MLRNFTMGMFGPDCDMTVIESAAYEAVMEHTHDFVELVCIQEGELEHRVQGRAVRLGAGDAFMLAPGVAHSMIPTVSPAERCRWVNCIFRPAYLSDDCRDIEGCRLLHRDEEPSVPVLMDMMASEFERQRPFYIERTRGMLISIVYAFRRASKRRMATHLVDRKARKDLFIHEATRYIQRNSRRRLSCQEIADAVGISVGYLNRLFREERATTPIDCLNMYRVTDACALLLRTDRAVSEIAEEVGFHDTKFFYIVFKRQNGMTPGAFRARNREAEAAQATEE